MDDSVQKKLQDLFVAYSKSLPDKIRAIELEWDELQDDWTLEKSKLFHNSIHRLCGSAGTYGYTEISQSARNLELYLKTILGHKKISRKELEEINYLLFLLKSSFTLQINENFPNMITESETENKMVYILEQDWALVKDLSESLEQVGYDVRSFINMDMFKAAVVEKPAIALIINTTYLDPSGIETILEIQKRLVSVQLFCILPNDSLFSRIQAIRAGCTAFFEKPIDIYHLTQVLNHKCCSSKEPYRILIIDDSESLAQYYMLILNQAGMIAKSISDPLQLLVAMEAFQPDLLLMDIYMPECTGLELAAVLRQEKQHTRIPIIFLSTEDDKLKKLMAINLGGDDFLTKPVSPQHLISAVRARSKRASALNYYMTSDSLTGLLNHASIMHRLTTELFHARQKNAPLTFIMIDLDHFKEVNDSHGHQAGDMVIKKLATLLLVRLRSQDIIGRYGGEEFAIVLPGTHLEQGIKICDELRQQFSEYCFNGGNIEYYVSFSAGVSCLREDNDATTMVTEADFALYQAKQQGRNRVMPFKK